MKSAAHSLEIGMLLVATLSCGDARQNSSLARKAAECNRKGEYEQTLEITREPASAGKASADLLYEQGFALNRLGDFSGAAASLRDASARSQDQPAIQVELGRALANLADYSGAVTALEHGRSAGVLDDEGSLLLARNLLLAGRHEEAARRFQSLLDAYPVEARFGLGCAAEQGGDLAAASNCFYEALVRDPRHLAATYALARTLCRRGLDEWSEAVRVRHTELASWHDRLDFERRNTAGSSASFVNFMNLASVCAEGEFLHEAIAALEKALALRPNLPEASHALARHYLALEKLGQVRKWSGYALNLDPKDPIGCLYAAVAAIRQGRAEESELLLQRAQSGKAFGPDEHLLLAESHRLVGDLETAEREMASAREKGRGRSDVQRASALLCLHRKEHERALSFAESACSLAPSDDLAQMLVGVAQHRLGRLEEARKAFAAAAISQRATLFGPQQSAAHLRPLTALPDCADALALYEELRRADLELAFSTGSGN